MLREGQRLAHYRIMYRLRSGGMGEIYLADDLQLRRHVAIKVMKTNLSHYTDDEEAQEAARLFLREMQVIGQLEHQHILPVYDADEEFIEDSTLMYMVMPFRPEGSLTDWLRKRGTSKMLLPRDVERIVRQAASALQYAHDHDIIHQDVKPSNFLVFGEAEMPSQLHLQLADFGVAKFMMSTSESFTIRGTPIYMAPEQWEGRPVPATDQYALAIMTYELLTGRPPFVGRSHQHLWNQHHNVAPLPPSRLNLRLPKQLDPILLRALAKEPTQRFDSVATFARVFHQTVLNREHIVALNPTEKGTSPTQASTVMPPTIMPTTPLANVRSTVMQPPVQVSPPETPRKRLNGRVILQFSFVCAFIAACILSFFYFKNSQIATDNMNATATSGTHNASAATTLTGVNTTATVHAQTISTASSANSTNTVLANETDTAQTTSTAIAMHATATVQTVNATATAQAVSATSTAQAINATATVYATVVANGTPTLDDPLQNNNASNGWDITPTANGVGCAFTGKVYQAVEAQSGYFATCFAQSTDFSNLAYQVQMTIEAGDQGGITFRSDSSTGSFYYFEINKDGTYMLKAYSNYTLMPKGILLKGFSAAIKTGLKQTNLIAITAVDNTITLYVNMQYIGSITDNSYYHGQIGVVAEDIGHPTEVVFSNAKVWAYS